MQQILIINRLYSVLFHLSSVLCRLPSTSVENPLQIDPFMQNKPNFQYARMNLSASIKMTYKKANLALSEVEWANSNPIKPNLKRAKMNVNSFITKDYRKKDDFIVRINKPNFRNGQNERKLNFNKGLQKKRLFSTPKNKPNSNPIKACPERSEFTLSVIEGNGPILKRMNINFCAAGYYRRVALVPLNEHIDIIYHRFSASNLVIIFNLELKGIYLFESIDDACNIPGVNSLMVFFFMHRSV